MSEFYDILAHKGRAKAAIKKLHLKQLEELQEIIEERIVEAKKEETDRFKMEAKQEKALEEIRRIAAEAGIEIPTEALAIVKKKRAGLSRDEDKYQITDIHGYQRSWSGFGHPPAQFKQAFLEGIEKESMLKENHATLKHAFTETTKCVKITPEEKQGNKKGGK